MKQKRYLYLSDIESSVILQSLIRLKNSLTRQGRYTDCVDDLILKMLDAPTKRVKTTCRDFGGALATVIEKTQE